MFGYTQFSKRLVINRDFIQSPNLCDRLEDEDLTTLGELVWEGYRRDEFSRERWRKRTEAGMDLAMQVQKEKTFPWPNCSNVVFPLITIAALQFSARSYSNIVQGTDIVQYRHAAPVKTQAMLDRAKRISEHMSWQCLEEDKAWEEQHDRLLINLGIVGTSFIKTYHSSRLGYDVSELVLAQDLVMDYYAKSVDECARKTQIIPLYRNDIYERAMRGTFRDVLEEEWFQQPSPVTAQPRISDRNNREGLNVPQSDEDTPFRTLEQHRLLDLDQDGYAEPYIVTIEESSKKVLRIVARFDREEDVERKTDHRSGRIISIRPTEYYTKYSFIPSPDNGIYDIGFGVLLGPLNEAVSSGINQILDSGTMQNSLGGFLGRGAKIRGGLYTMAPWEWKRVDSTGDDLRKNLVPYPDRQPSVVMFQLLGLLINYCDRLAGTTEAMTGQNVGQNTPAYNMREMLNQGMQVYNVIFKRVWRSSKEEFKKRHRLNSIYLPIRREFGEDQFILREDYKSNPDWVVPSADPNLTSDAARFQQATAVRQAAYTAPGYNIEAVERRYLKAMRVEAIDEIYPGPDKAPPLPNPKAQVEEMKLKARQLQIENERWKLVTQLQADRQKNLAEIAKLKAETAAILISANVELQAQRLASIEVALEAFNRHEELLNERIGQLMGAGGEASGESNSESGGLRGMEDQSGNGSVPEVSEGMGGESEGSMGEGNVSVQ